jgi:hypothetical protein
MPDDDEAVEVEADDVMVDNDVRDLEVRKWRKSDTERIEALALLADAITPLLKREAEFARLPARPFKAACAILETIAAETRTILTTQPRSPLREDSPGASPYLPRPE